MGLAEPRKRIKISHDPRNTSWTNSSDSYGQRLMQQQGWQAGEALGANGRGSNYSDAEAAKVKIQYKDDMLGLGATLKSKDIANQRTGFDAFQGLLGRLNAKTEEEVKVVEKKLEDKKLAMYAQGRWGGMIFVPGGILVQSDPYKQVEAIKKAQREKEAEPTPVEMNTDQVEPVEQNQTSARSAEKAKRKAEKQQKREEKRLRKEAKRLKKDSKVNSDEDEVGLPTPDHSSGNEASSAEKKAKEKKSKSKKHERATELEMKPEAVIKSVAIQIPARNGRHLLRGKNIQAKRMAFSDTKGLDEIFMRAG